MVSSEKVKTSFDPFTACPSYVLRVEIYFVVFHDMHTKIMNPELPVIKYFLDRNV